MQLEEGLKVRCGSHEHRVLNTRVCFRVSHSLNWAKNETLKCRSNCQIKHDNGDPGGGAVLFGERIIKVLF